MSRLRYKIIEICLRNNDLLFGRLHSGHIGQQAKRVGIGATGRAQALTLQGHKGAQPTDTTTLRPYGSTGETAIGPFEVDLETTTSTEAGD